MTTTAPVSVADVAAALRDDRPAWNASEPRLAQLLEACAAQDLVGLLYHRVRHQPAYETWPRSVRENLAGAARRNEACELPRRREIASALDALAAAGIHPILLKGTPLAYSVYPTAASRPRLDCDVIIRRDDVGLTRRTMHALGYSAPLMCDGDRLFCQFSLVKSDTLGVVHAFDVHWKISTQALFADLLTYEELARDRIPVAPLGAHAWTASPAHALLLACIHPVMHHQNSEHLIWVYDVHLLASRLSGDELDRFAALARAKQVTAIVAHQLALAHQRFGTRIPHRVIAALIPQASERSAVYLRPGRRWHNELISNLIALRSWRDRARLLREIVFPDPRYMLERYGAPGGSMGVMLLPALHVHRLMRGILKIVRGRK